MLNTLIVGASGYAGAELVSYVNRHPHMTITALTVSAQSNDAGKLISDLHPQLKGLSTCHCNRCRMYVTLAQMLMWCSRRQRMK